jgi:putative transposase
MARLPRFCPAGLPQHIIQRGNNRNICFADDQDFAAYAHWLYECSMKFRVDIHAWVFMTNHVHLLATPSADNSISLMMQALGRRYVQYFNFTYQRSGTLWEGRYKSSIVDTEKYLLVCYRYIELNPVRANIVNDPVEYKWSSYRHNALGVNSIICTPHKNIYR